MPKKNATAAATSALFGGKAKPKPVKRAGKNTEREVVAFPPALIQAALVGAAFRQIKTDLEKKGRLADKQVQAHMLRWWCERFAISGKRPEMTHFVGGDAHMDLVVTRRITLTAEKQEALEMLGADITEYVETSGIEIDMDAIKALGYMEDLQTAIQKLVGPKKVCPSCNTESSEDAKFCHECAASLSKVKAGKGNPEHIAQIFSPKIIVKEGILEGLPSIAEGCDGDDGLADKIEALVQVLKPVVQVKKAHVEGKDAAEAFTLVYESKLAAK